ncbi:MAG: AI-2E family transporter [Methylocystis sp.]|uniref:AI-2E family transporter n=1 Tax=Methylocystis sp. TaxID=1911079 RepID=UPI003D152C32
MKIFGARGLATKKDPQDQALLDFALRTIIVLLICIGVIVLWRLTEAIIAAFASVVVAVAWRGAARPITEHFKLPPGLSLLAVAIIIVSGVGLATILFGNHLLKQYDDLAQDIPAALSVIKESVEAHPWGRFLEHFVAGVDLSKATAPLAMQFASFIGSLGRVLALTAFIFLGAAYLAVDPDRYVEGLVALAPDRRKAELSRFLNKSATMLRRWLSIQLYVVVLNAGLVGVGLWFTGVDAPIALATISGALAFIPYFGSIVAIVIGALAALPQGLSAVLFAAGVIGAASFVEGYLITPYLQSEALVLPPVTLLFFMLALGTLFGVMGVVLAVPATVVLASAFDVLTENEKPQETSA